MTTNAGSATREIATLGGGCFWCLEAVFEQLRGVDSAMSGYAGGSVENPTYEQVCTGRTGHAEVIQVTFDPAVITFEELLEVFFAIHDPTTLNRQGADVGTQYRSVIYYHSPEQQQQARQVIDRLNASHQFGSPLVTEVSPYTKFFLAEGYHHGYFRANGHQPYCQMVVSPKVAKFRTAFANRLKD